jgi:hypothetical protein
MKSAEALPHTYTVKAIHTHYRSVSANSSVSLPKARSACVALKTGLSGTVQPCDAPSYVSLSYAPPHAARAYSKCAMSSAVMLLRAATGAVKGARHFCSPRRERSHRPHEGTARRGHGSR